MTGLVTKIRRRERPGVAMVEYLVPRLAGQRIHHKHAHAFLAHDGTCINVHVSKMRFKPEDRGLFDDVLESFRIRGEAATRR